MHNCGSSRPWTPHCASASLRQHRPGWWPPPDMPCSRVAHASVRASVWRWPGPAATTVRRWPMPPRWPSSCSTAPRWSTTTCPASTTPPCAVVRPRSMQPLASGWRCWSATRSSCSPSARWLWPERTPRTVSAGSSPPWPMVSAPPRASSPGRPGSARPRPNWPPTSAPRPARCSLPPPLPVPRLPAMIRTPGVASATGWARPIRWPTTSATSWPIRRCSASRPAATRISTA